MKTQTKTKETMAVYVSKVSKVQLTKEALKRRRSISEIVDILIEDWLKGGRTLSVDE